MPDRPKLTLSKKGHAAEVPPTRPALAEQAEAERPGLEDAPRQDVAADVDSVTVPAAIWARMRKLAELGERVEKGEFKPAAAVDEALNAVEQMRQAMEHRRGHSSIEGLTPRDGPPEAQAVPATAMDAYIAVLRRPR